jgi:pimeloyl-ACP methyl ester carboxylesterase
MLSGVRRHRVQIPETGVEIALIDWGGDGPPALLQHANGFCAALWDGVAERLRERFRLFAMDARGQGDSSRPEGSGAFDWANMARDAEAVGQWVLSETGAPRLALGVGHSFGGTLTLAASVARPALYERLLLVDPVLVSAAGSAMHALRGEGNGPNLAERARKRRDGWDSREEAHAFFGEKPLFEHWEAWALDVYIAEALRETPGGKLRLKCAGEVEAAVFGGGVAFDLFELAARIECPTRMLWAKRASFPRPFFEALAERIPRAVIEDVDAGHLIPMERPSAVAEAVDRLLEQ